MFRIVAILFIFLLGSASNAWSQIAMNLISPKSDTVYMAHDPFEIHFLQLGVDSVNIDLYMPRNGGTWVSLIDSFPAKTSTRIQLDSINVPDWGSYNLRIVDIHHKAETVYSGKFTVLNASKPTLYFGIDEDTSKVSAKFNLHYAFSPSVNSVVLQVLRPLSVSWETLPNKLNKSEASLILTPNNNYQTGTYLYRIYDAEHNTFSAADSIYLIDDLFAGLLYLSPANGETDVNIRLNNQRSRGNISIRYNEPVKLGADKTLDLYHETAGLVASFSTSDANVKLSSNNRVLTILPPLPLIHTSNYYLIMDDGFVTDFAGNPSGGFQSSDQWTFSTVQMYNINGTIFYSGLPRGTLYYGLYSQSDISNNDFSSPIDIASEFEADFPFPYQIAVPKSDTFGIFVFQDYNDNLLPDNNEPSVFAESVIINNADTFGVDLILKESSDTAPVFRLEAASSYYGNLNPIKYNHFFNSFQLGQYGKGNTACVKNPKQIMEGFFKTRFFTEENGEDELINTDIKPGTRIHLEYSYPDSVDINFIAASANVSEVIIEPERLVIELEVIDPAASASGDRESACGFIISCSPSHSANIPAYASIMYSNISIEDMRLLSASYSQSLGLNLQGIDTVETNFTVLLSDSFLINTFEEFRSDNLPPNSLNFKAEIPGGALETFSYNNTFGVDKTHFDIDGDGIKNRMYKVAAQFTGSSGKDVIFTLDPTTDDENLSVENLNLRYFQASHSILSNVPIQTVHLIDLTGKIVFTNNVSSSEFNLPTHLKKGIYLYRCFSGQFCTGKIIIY